MRLTRRIREDLGLGREEINDSYDYVVVDQWFGEIRTSDCCVQFRFLFAESKFAHHSEIVFVSVSEVRFFRSPGARAPANDSLASTGDPPLLATEWTYISCYLKQARVR